MTKKSSLFVTFFVISSFIFSFSGCRLNKLVADNMTATMDDQKESFYREASVAHAMAGAPALLKLLDGFIISSPENPDLLIRAAELNCGFAMLLIEQEDPEWASALYKRGFDYVDKVLKARLPGYKDAVTIDDFVAALAKAKKKDIDAVFWAGDCLGSYLNLNLSDPEVMGDLPKVAAFAQRALELDETYFFGGPHLFLGFLYGAVGESVGGNPEASRMHFERAFEITEGKFLLSKVFFAKSYCVQTQNRELFEEVLEGVIDYPDYPDSEFLLVNVASKKQAEALLDRADDLFLD
ncbi:MAG: hypothetical protein BWX66_00081 [Deltaproteobacteria bacterium ADurb.Bin058]|jgi:hypothetical protein|nr:MAG: hypothetical protein BWX66_00081 [Deltaproteobacteria bacterium ADurb.Bin058]